jgi:hypothetical protein
MRNAIALCILLAACVCGGAAAAQGRTGSDTATTRRSSGYDPLIAWATIWGDTGHTGAYTCEEWKRYATRLFNDADKNRDGYVDAQEFKAIQQADLILRGSDLAYFDDNRDGRLSRAEFVDKPNQFFARYDLKHQCKVTMDDIVDVAAPPGKARGGRADR